MPPMLSSGSVRRSTARALLAGALLAASATLVGAAAASAAAPVSAPPAIAGYVSDSVNMSGALAVAVSGHYAYTTAYFSGRLVAVDISTPAHPRIAGMSAYSPALLDASTVNVAGGFAYVVAKNRNASTSSNDDGNSGNSLTILNLATDPAQPAIVGTLHDSANLFGAYGVAAAGRYAYVAAQGLLAGQPAQPDTSSGAFDVIDISNPTVPRIVATISDDALPGRFAGSGALHHATAVAVSGSYAYVTAAYSNRLTVIDIANPLAPVIVGSLQDNTALAVDVDVAVQGHYAYVVDQSLSHPTLAVVDVANPAAPKVVATASGSYLKGAYRIRVRGDFAYIASSTAGALAVIDISTPTSPRFVAGVYDHLAHLHAATGLDLDPSGRYAIVASPDLSTQPTSAYPPYPLEGGPTVTGTLTTIALDPARLSVAIVPSSEPASPSQATSVSFHFRSSDVVSAASCELDSRPPKPCGTETSQSYSRLKPGRHTFTVTVTGASGATASRRHRWLIAPHAWQIAGSLRRQLVPKGAASSIRAILSDHGYVTRLQALGPGRAVVDWYWVPHGGSLALSKGHRRLIAPRGAAAPVLLATGRQSFRSSGDLNLTLRLTAAGASLLGRVSRIRVFGVGSFKAAGDHAVLEIDRFRLWGGREAQPLG
jgi:hypothetical protein